MSACPCLSFLQEEPIRPNVKNAYVGINEVASAGHAEVLHAVPLIANNIGVAVVVTLVVVPQHRRQHQ